MFDKMYEQASESLPERWSVEVREEGCGGSQQCDEGAGGIAVEARAGKAVVIYALTSPDGEIRYVGKTVVKLYQRLCQHYRAGKNTYKDAWIASLKNLGLKPKIIELERIENSDDYDWQEAERFWIAYLRFLGCRLTNLDVGGNGGNLKSEETKKKIGTGNRGKTRTLETLKKLSESHTGVKLSPEHCASMSKAVKGKPRGPYPKERCEKIAAALRGRKQPPRSKEHCANISKAQKGKVVSLETRSKISASQKGKKRGPYTKERAEKISLALKGRVTPPEQRENQRLAALRRWGKLPPTPSA